jgi:tRNA(Arg) A34 adenosine deaminase TadA
VSRYLKSKLTYSLSTHARIVVSLPEWADEFFESVKDTIYSCEEEMMAVAIELSNRNVLHNTGGPFGTAIFECDTATGECRLFSIGMNRVVPLNNSTLHGEMVAIQFGQQKLQSFSFRVKKALDKEYHLYTSCEPCCQCLGGTLWSGVSKVVCAATKEDAEALGFDEGPVFPQSYDALEAAGIKVVRRCLRAQGARVLKQYGEKGVIYNGSSSSLGLEW